MTIATRLTRPAALLAWGFALSIGCASIAGLDELEPAATTSVGGSATGGTGGSGGTGTASGGTAGAGAVGGGGTVFAADWTDFLMAVYLFEGGDVGEDSAGADHDLVGPVGDPEQQEPPDAPQGTHVAYFDSSAPNPLESESGDFGPAQTDSFTWGGWFKVQTDEAMIAVSRLNGSSGYALRRLSGGAWCQVELDTGSQRAEGGVWTDGIWTHVVCRQDTAGNEISAHVDGARAAEVSVTGLPTSGGGAYFKVGEDGAGTYGGRMDEVFFVMQALPDNAIRRIWACEIDGSRCTCVGSSPGEYSNCGRPDPDCANLPPCNQTNPF
ncbi:MAG: hypothetical protein JRI23_09955, partial [Deltaproteobacteria bacterium]|nr:hypothetical protein [Deltaproteobacteria bacterium]MBW2531995.1 hypothetical protein [Deltaproteobacteria bacterium]